MPADNYVSNHSEREWKKAVFARWDEFKNVKADMAKRLAEGVSSIPDNIVRMESEVDLLRKSEEQMNKLLEDIRGLDDSEWNRHSFTSELAKGMKKLENIRIQYVMISSRLSPADNGGSKTLAGGHRSSHGFVHELNSLSKSQLFRLGLAFFMPLIFGILLAVVVWGIMYYVSLH